MPKTNDPRLPSVERLRALLEAYGAAPERWPDEERAGAEALLARSAAARAQRAEAEALDRLLDAAPVTAPSAALTGRVLAAAPRSRAARVWRRALVAAVPLAAAAALVVWFGIDRSPDRQAASEPVVAIGEYSSPTDALLDWYGIDVSGTVPSVGCSDSVLGCPNVERAAKPYSQRPRRGGLLA
jgi:hypothetical protein